MFFFFFNFSFSLLCLFSIISCFTPLKNSIFKLSRVLFFPAQEVHASEFFAFCNRGCSCSSGLVVLLFLFILYSFLRIIRIRMLLFIPHWEDLRGYGSMHSAKKIIKNSAKIEL